MLIFRHPPSMNFKVKALPWAPKVPPARLGPTLLLILRHASLALYLLLMLLPAATQPLQMFAFVPLADVSEFVLLATLFLLFTRLLNIKEAMWAPQDTACRRCLL